jgi:hypothetical protein
VVVGLVECRTEWRMCDVRTWLWFHSDNELVVGIRQAAVCMETNHKHTSKLTIVNYTEKCIGKDCVREIMVTVRFGLASHKNLKNCKTKMLINSSLCTPF